MRRQHCSGALRRKEGGTLSQWRKQRAEGGLVASHREVEALEVAKQEDQPTYLPAQQCGALH